MTDFYIVLVIGVYSLIPSKNKLESINLSGLYSHGTFSLLYFSDIVMIIDQN